ncbi:PepSY domain-containing protein [Streptomyces chumphonensis]|uniref:PepSY domain-containing protein n=1 Tax=Streptomyces chumphonensis TaxID=1214925 RepID=UPI003D737645
MKRNQIIAVLAAAGIIAGGAVTGTALASDDGADGGSRQLRSAGAADSEPGAQSASDQGPAGPREAVERALAEVPGLAAGLELEDDDRVWEVRVLREDGTYREVEVDREDGSVLGQDHSDDDADDDGDGPASVRAALAGAKVSLADAARIAAGQDRGTVEEIELEDGSWAVEYADEGSSDDADDGVRIDLTSGAVSPDTDDDRDDRDDKDDRDDDRDDV